MKIVQSYWSLPSQSGPMVEGRDNGGWLHKRYHYLSMSLSCLLLRRFYSEVELITDSAGKELLIDILKLPYTSISTELDRFSDYPPILWALPKLYSYSIQKTPFLHVDSDVFIWEAFKSSVVNAAVVAQSPELEHQEIYKNSLLHICELIGYVPEPFISCSGENIQALNAGVLGGVDVDFLSYYGLTALNLIKDNIELLRSKCKIGTVNIILEQLLLYKLCESNNKNITYIIPTLSLDFKEVLNFHAVPVLQTFVHLIGYAKKSLLACEQVEFRLKYEFPDHYDRISKLIEGMTSLSTTVPVNNNEYGVQLDFVRTRSVLEQLGIVCARTKQLTYKDFRNIVKIVDREPLKLYIHDIYQLDKSLKNNISQIDKAELWTYKQRAYEALDKRSQQYILSCPLTLARSIALIQTKWSLESLNSATLWQHIVEGDNNSHHYIMTQKNNDMNKEEELFGWDQLLVHFHNNVISGEELLLELNDSDFSQPDIKQLVVNFILVETIYTGRLIMR